MPSFPWSKFETAQSHKSKLIPVPCGSAGLFWTRVELGTLINRILCVKILFDASAGYINRPQQTSPSARRQLGKTARNRTNAPGCFFVETDYGSIPSASDDSARRLLVLGNPDRVAAKPKWPVLLAWRGRGNQRCQKLSPRIRCSLMAMTRVLSSTTCLLHLLCRSTRPLRYCEVDQQWPQQRVRGLDFHALLWLACMD